jgi:hypothetical protein
MNNNDDFSSIFKDIPNISLSEIMKKFEKFKEENLDNDIPAVWYPMRTRPLFKKRSYEYILLRDDNFFALGSIDSFGNWFVDNEGDEISLSEYEALGNPITHWMRLPDKMNTNDILNKTRSPASTNHAKDFLMYAAQTKLLDAKLERLRDEFAMEAMKSIMRELERKNDWKLDHYLEFVSTRAYEIADAMLKVRGAKRES